MTSSLLRIALAVLVAGTGHAQAQDLSTSEARKLVEDYGRCVVKDQHRRASQAILANVDNSQLLASYSQLIVPRCMTVLPGTVVRVRFSGDQYRYALADALVRREFRDQPAPNLDLVPRLDHRDPGLPPPAVDSRGRPLSAKKFQEALNEHKQAQAFSYLSRYGECVVRLNPEGARTLLLTNAGSDAETEAFRALATPMSNCLPEGQTLEFGKLALRGTIAVNYYRLAHGAGPATERG